jgi:hypothetical protein
MEDAAVRIPTGRRAKSFEWSYNNEKQRYGRKLHEAIGFGVLTAVKSCSLVGGVVFLET